MCALALVIAATAALPGNAWAQKYLISSEVWGHFEDYLRRIKDGQKPGAFVITEDGYGAWFVWCEQTRCMPGITYSQEALNDCEREYQTDCVVFAQREKIKVEYEVIGRGSATSPDAAAPVVKPVPTTRIVVAAAVEAEIRTYLNNARRSGIAWALAVARDGSEVAWTGCSTSTNYLINGGGGCMMSMGSPQEVASRMALARCGGDADCALLYEGAQKKPSFELVLADGTPFAPQAAAVTPIVPEPIAPPATTPDITTPEPEPVQVAVAAPPPSPPPPAVKITVSSAVQAKIDAYLGNTKRSGRAWALAIANDGSDVAFASCPTSGSWSGGRGCEPVKGGPQELASREAIMRCGGAADCSLLYEGAAPRGNIEIVMQ